MMLGQQFIIIAIYTELSVVCGAATTYNIYTKAPHYTIIYKQQQQRPEAISYYQYYQFFKDSITDPFE